MRTCAVVCFFFVERRERRASPSSCTCVFVCVFVYLRSDARLRPPHSWANCETLGQRFISSESCSTAKIIASCVCVRLRRNADVCAQVREQQNRRQPQEHHQQSLVIRFRRIRVQLSDVCECVCVCDVCAQCAIKRSENSSQSTVIETRTQSHDDGKASWDWCSRNCGASLAMKVSGVLCVCVCVQCSGASALKCLQIAELQNTSSNSLDI